MENMWHKEEEHGGAVKQDGGGRASTPLNHPSQSSRCQIGQSAWAVTQAEKQIFWALRSASKYNQPSKQSTCVNSVSCLLFLSRDKTGMKHMNHISLSSFKSFKSSCEIWFNLTDASPNGFL